MFRSRFTSPNKCEYCNCVDWMSVMELLDFGKFKWNTSVSKLRLFRLFEDAALGEWGNSEKDRL